MSRGMAGVWMTEIQGQVSLSLPVSTWSDGASQTSKCPCSILCTSPELHDFVHSARITEVRILLGIVLGSGIQ